MANINDYLKWRGDLSFKVSPFNEVDNLILSEIAYLNLDKIINNKSTTIKWVIEEYLKKYDKKAILSQFPLSKNPISFFENVKNSYRFGSLKISHYVNKISKKEEKQFSSIIIKLNFNTIYVAFKGTDNTLIGWKEDFNMSFMEKVPSQLEAVAYLNKNIHFYNRHIYIGGHSKGGNLAVFASVGCKKNIQKRLILIYNNDGPGFLEDFIALPKYNEILSKIVTTIPETSIIGMLLNHKEEYKVVKSTALGIWQHDCLSWEVAKDHFITLKEVDETSNKIRKTITDWLQNINKKQREIFINTLFKILENNKIETVEHIAKLKLRKIPGLVREFAKIDEETKKVMMELLKELMREANKNFDKKTIFYGLRHVNKKE